MSSKRIWNIIIWALVLTLLFVPQTRVFIQQQFMKLGFFKPKLESVAVDDSVQNTTTPALKSAVSFKDEQGKIYNVEELKGKVVFVNFWATWCPPCKAEMPSIQKLYDKFKNNENVVFLLVEIENNLDGANQFLAQEHLSLPIAYPNSNIPEEWLSGAIPTTVILNKKGELVSKEEGMRDYSAQSVTDYIQNLINQ